MYKTGSTVTHSPRKKAVHVNSEPLKHAMHETTGKASHPQLAAL